MSGFEETETGNVWAQSDQKKSVVKRRISYIWDLSSAGRASALQAEGHRFEPCRSHVSISHVTTSTYGGCRFVTRFRLLRRHLMTFADVAQRQSS